MFRRALISKPFSTAVSRFSKISFGLEGIFPGAVGGGVADRGLTAWVRASIPVVAVMKAAG